MSTEIAKHLGSNWVEVRKVTLPPTIEAPEWEHQWKIYFIWNPEGGGSAESFLGEFIFWAETEIPTHGDSVQANRKVDECVKKAEVL